MQAKYALGCSLLGGGALAILLAGLVLMTSIQKAEHKKLWADEELEIYYLCSMSLRQTLIGDTKQTNKYPFYYAIQKLVISRIDNFDASLLIRYRLVSFIAASLLAFILFIFLHNRLGQFWAGFTLISLTGQRLFYHFASENRHYMIWMLTFALLLMATTNLCSRNWDAIKIKYKILFALSCLIITLVIAMGVIQTITAVVTCLFCWYYIQPHPKDAKAIKRFMFLLLLICVIIAMYYGLKGVDAFHENIMNSNLNLLTAIKRGDLNLLKMPPRLLLPKVARDAYLGVYLSNILVVIGVFAPVFLWKYRDKLKNSDAFVFTLSLVTTAQVIATIPIAAVVALLQYWFVERIFIYLLVCHAVLATAGGYFVIRGVGQNTFLQRKMGGLVLISICSFLITASVLWHRQYYTEPRKPFPKCQPLNGKLSSDLQISSQGYLTNFAIEVSEYLKHCGWGGKPDADSVFLWHDPNDIWYLTPEIPDHGEPLIICGHPVSFKVG